MKRARSAALAAVVVLGGCIKLTPREEALLAEYRADPRPPAINEEIHDDGTAGALSALFPGVGHFYMGEIWLGIRWILFGLPTWPLMIPCAAANQDAETLNLRHIANEYARLRPRGPVGPGGDNVNVNQNVNVSAPPVVNVPVTVVTQQAPATTTTPAASPPGPSCVCGEALPARAKFCPACGTAAQATACKCGATLAADAKFCSECGEQR